MDIFWDDFIEPILRELTKIEPAVIVEVGSSSGANTKNILEFCKESKSFCHIIDPVEIGNYEEIKDLLQAHGKHHKSLSLEVLSLLNNPTVYLLDGDHNWFTVFHELKIIYELNIENKAAESYPTIFFHDVEWPYAKRDLYYNASQIPADFKQPSFTGGLIPGEAQLNESFGVNFGMDQALLEGGERNGVLTAIEDFIQKYDLLKSYYFFVVPGNSGLGCLFPKARYREDTVRFVHNQLVVPEHIAHYVRKFADAFWKTELKRSTQQFEFDNQVKKYNSLVEKYGELVKGHQEYARSLEDKARRSIQVVDKLNSSKIFKLLLTVRGFVQRLKQVFQFQ